MTAHRSELPRHNTSPADTDLVASSESITLADLPPPGTTRWVVSRKAAVVAGVRTGLITIEEACQRYALSVEEFLCWKRLLDDFGVKGLRTTRTKEYRSKGQVPQGLGDHAGESPMPLVAAAP
jgi:hypothetical protein